MGLFKYILQDESVVLDQKYPINECVQTACGEKAVPSGVPEECVVPELEKTVAQSVFLVPTDEDVVPAVSSVSKEVQETTVIIDEETIPDPIISTPETSTVATEAPVFAGCEQARLTVGAVVDVQDVYGEEPRSVVEVESAVSPAIPKEEYVENSFIEDEPGPISAVMDEVLAEDVREVRRVVPVGDGVVKGMPVWVPEQDRMGWEGEEVSVRDSVKSVTQKKVVAPGMHGVAEGVAPHVDCRSERDVRFAENRINLRDGRVHAKNRNAAGIPPVVVHARTKSSKSCD